MSYSGLNWAILQTQNSKRFSFTKPACWENLEVEYSSREAFCFCPIIGNVTPNSAPSYTTGNLPSQSSSGVAIQSTPIQGPRCFSRSAKPGLNAVTLPHFLSTTLSPFCLSPAMAPSTRSFPWAPPGLVAPAPPRAARGSSASSPRDAPRSRPHPAVPAGTGTGRWRRCMFLSLTAKC